MDFDLRRLRNGERITAACALALFIVLFFLKWYGPKGNLSGYRAENALGSSINGWHGHTVLRWLILLTIIVALWSVFVTASQRTPALPVAGSVLTSAAGIVLSVLLLIRVVFAHPGDHNLVGTKFGAFLAVLLAIGVAVGGWLSMQDEGTSFREAGEALDGSLGGVGRGRSEPAIPARPAPPAEDAPAEAPAAGPAAGPGTEPASPGP